MPIKPDCAKMINNGFPLDASCFQAAINYPGNDLVINGYPGVPSEYECFAKCLNFNGCKFFTFRFSDLHCFLKTSRGEPSPEAGITSGGLGLCKGSKISFFFSISFFSETLKMIKKYCFMLF